MRGVAGVDRVLVLGVDETRYRTSTTTFRC